MSLKNFTLNVVQNINITEFMNNFENSKNSSSIIFEGESFKIQIQSSSEKSINEARENKLPFVNFVQCEKKLKENGILPIEEKLYSANLIYKQDLFVNNKTSSNDISISNSISPQIIDSKGNLVDTSLCKDIQIKTPVNNNILNMTEYESIINEKSINIFNSSELFFSDKCVPFQFHNNTDLTLEERRKKFNISGYCSSNGIFKGFDEYQYAICEYPKLPEESNMNFKKTIFGSLNNSNFYLFLCGTKAFRNIKSNPAFWSFIINLIFSISVSIVYYVFVPLKSNLETVYDNDVITISKEPEETGKSHSIKNNNIRENKNDQISKNIEVIKVNVDLKNKINDKENKILKLNVDINNDKNLKESSPKLVGDFDEYLDNKNINKDENNKSSYYNENVNNSNIQNNKSVIRNNNNLIIPNYNNIFDENDNSSQKTIRLNSNNIESNLVNNESDDYNKISKENIDNDSDKKDKEKSDEIIIKTYADFNSLTTEKKIKYDKSNVVEYIWICLKEKIEILNIFFIYSAITPIYIKLFGFFLGISIEFSLNAMFYSDELISNQANLKNKGGKVDIKWVLLEEFSKSFWPILISNAIVILTNFIIYVPEALSEEYNEKMLSNSEDERLKAM